MIEFKDGDYSVSVFRAGYRDPQVLAFVEFSRGTKDQRSVYIDKDLYHLLQQAMPIIGAIVEGE